MNEIRYADLFGGVGGFRLGIERANSLSRIEKGKIQTEDERGLSHTCEQNGNGGKQHPMYRCVFYSDIDKYSAQTYNKNFKENHEPTDITKIRTEDIPDIDMLCGGFPCQAFSIAGKRRGFEDTRGTLFFEVARIIKAKRPKIVFLENVKGLLNHNKGETFRTIIQTLSELGYNVQWMVLNSKFFGVPQNRERVFIIGSIGGECRPEILPFRESCEEIDKQSDWLSQQSVPTVFASQHKIARGMPMIQNHFPRSSKTGKGGTGLLESSESCFALDRSPHYLDKIRRLTPTECERLQGFPDGWTEGVSDTQRYKQMGNAVTVNVIEAIARRLLMTQNTQEVKYK